MEISRAAVDTINADTTERNTSNEFNPDERKPMETLSSPQEATEGYNPDGRKTAEVEPNEDGFYTPYSERMKYTPDKNVIWEGERGESLCMPNEETDIGKTAKEKLDELGLKGIVYKDGVPDFSSVAKATLEIDHMTEFRYRSGGNFEQFKTKYADKLNEKGKDGKTDWTPREVEDYFDKNNLVMHERCDCKTMDLLDRNVHECFKHSGGCNECKHRDGNAGGGLDA